MPVTKTTAGSQPRRQQGGQQRGAPVVLPPSGLAFPPVAPLPGRASTAQGGGLGRQLSGIADRMERNRMLKLSLDQREEDKKERKRAERLRVKMSNANELKLDEQKKVAFGRTSMLDMARDAMAQIGDPETPIQAVAGIHEAAFQATTEIGAGVDESLIRIMGVGELAAQAVTNSYLPGGGPPLTTEQVAAFADDYRQTRNNEKPYADADGVPDASVVNNRDDANSVMSMVHSLLHQAVEARISVGGVRTNLEKTAFAHAKKSVEIFNYAATSAIGATGKSDAETNLGLRDTIQAFLSYGRSPNFNATNSTRVTLGQVGKELAQATGRHNAFQQIDTLLDLIEDDPNAAAPVHLPAITMAWAEMLIPALQSVLSGEAGEALEMSVTFGKGEDAQTLTATASPTEFGAISARLTDRDKFVLRNVMNHLVRTTTLFRTTGAVRSVAVQNDVVGRVSRLLAAATDANITDVTDLQALAISMESQDEQHPPFNEAQLALFGTQLRAAQQLRTPPTPARPPAPVLSGPLPGAPAQQEPQTMGPPASLAPLAPLAGAGG